jgi:hypothetical protein
MANNELHFPLLVTEEKFERLVTEMATGKVYAKLGYTVLIPNPNGDGSVILNEEGQEMFKWEFEEAVVTIADMFDIPLQYFLDNGMVSKEHWQ